ncbi:MAG: NAD-dependent epimerase/dehydratase family protein, partial [Lachnospiraceae bacterium]|nr:NAD-dependent epimerase/dehydratase family protein [Lachnospiraceae bacterium]
MKILLIGGTGTISSAITRQLAETEHEVYVLNRGNNNKHLPLGIKQIIADINNEEQAKAALDGMTFDAVCDFIGFVPAQLERDYRLFAGKTKQFLFISSASAYHKPVR